MLKIILQNFVLYFVRNYNVSRFTQRFTEVLTEVHREN